MTKVEAAKLKAGDRVKVKGRMWESVSKIEANENGYLVYLEHYNQPISHKKLESNKPYIKARREAHIKELEEKLGFKI